MNTKKIIWRTTLIVAIFSTFFWLFFYFFVAISNDPDAKLADMDSKYATLEAQKATVDGLIIEKEEAYNELMQKYQANKDILELQKEPDHKFTSPLCPWSIPMNYQSNKTIHQDLRNYIKQSYGKVSESEWFPIWTDDEVTIHHIVDGDDYFYMFLVYMGDPDYENIRGVFDVINQCWLNWDEQEITPPTMT